MSADHPTAPPPDADATLPPPDDNATLPPPDDHSPAGGATPPPGYEILGELGRGGMGVVYRARQTRLNRDAALKMVLGADRAEPRELIRFLAEAEAVAAVNHPGVVQVYDFGEHDGRPFLAMEYLPGGSLADRIAAGRLDPHPAAGLVGSLARAVQAAHDAGVVHRDLKPTNVLFDAVGQPRVTDFGLAKRGSHDLTKTGAIMGTPAYMAPEQARGQTKFVGPAADVYALGVILFECLTGTLPFHADDTVALLMKVANDDPPAVRSRVPGVPRDLDLICRKCLAKEPHERYATAGDLADDLGRFAAGQPVSVRAAGPVERAAKWARRNPTRAAAYSLTLLAVVLVGLTTGAVWLWQRAEHDRLDAEGSRDSFLKLLGELNLEHNKSINALARETLALQDAERARDSERKAKDALVGLGYARDVDLAHREYQADNFDRAKALLDACPRDLRNWEWQYVRRLCNGHLFVVRRPGEGVHSATYSADGRRILTYVSNSTYRVWDAETGRHVVSRTGPAGSFLTVALHPTAAVVATTDLEGRVTIWDTETGNRVRELTNHSVFLSRLRFSPDGSLLLIPVKGVFERATPKPAVGALGSLLLVPVKDGFEVWDWAAGARRMALVDPGLGSPEFSPDGTRLIALDKTKGAVVRFDTRTGAAETVLAAGTPKEFDGAVISPDGSRMVTSVIRSGLGRYFTEDSAADQRTSTIWDLSTGKVLAKIADPERDFIGGRFSGDGRRLLTWNTNGSVRIWTTDTGRERATLGFRGDAMRTDFQGAASFSPDGEYVLTDAGVNGPVQVWKAATGRLVATLKGIGGRAARFSPDGRRILTGDGRVWDAETAIESRTVQAAEIETELDPDSGGRDTWPFIRYRLEHHNSDRVEVVEMPAIGTAGRERKASERKALTGHTGVILAAALSGDAKWVVTNGSDRTVRVWNLETGKAVRVLERVGGSKASAAISATGTWVAVRSPDGDVRVTDVATGSELAAVRWPAAGNSRLRFVGSGRLVFTPSGETGVIWGWARGGPPVVLSGHVGHTVDGAGASPTDDRVVTHHANGVTVVWNAADGNAMLTLRPTPVDGTLEQQIMLMTGVGFTRDGKRIVVRHFGGTATVWDCSPIAREWPPAVFAPLFNWVERLRASD